MQITQLETREEEISYENAVKKISVNNHIHGLINFSSVKSSNSGSIP